MEEWTKELPPPEGSNEEDAVELLRAWVVDGLINFQIRDGIIEEPEQFGAMLADLALESAFLFGEDEEAATLAFERMMAGFGQRLDDTGEEMEEEDPQEE